MANKAKGQIVNGDYQEFFDVDAFHADEKINMVQPLQIIEHVRAWSGYASGTSYYGYYIFRDTEGEESHGYYVIPVRAGVLYTIIPMDTERTRFCTNVSFDEPADEVKEAWSKQNELLYQPTFTNLQLLTSRYVSSLSDRQTKVRFTPTEDGYIVGTWYLSSGALVYEGESPHVGWENFLNDPNDTYSIQNAPLYPVTEQLAERMKLLNVAPLSNAEKRAFRSGQYYKDLLCSTFQLVCIGDSITFGASVGVGNRYHDFLQSKLGISRSVWAQNSGTITAGYGATWENGETGVDGIIGSYLTSSLDINDDTDVSFQKGVSRHNVFTIALGTNDWIYNAPLGSYSDSVDTHSFFGSYKKLIAKIRTLYPNSSIILLCPWQQYYNNIHWYEQNNAGCSIKTYAMAIHEIAMMTRNAWVIDMLNSPYITEKDNSESGVYVDGVHIGRKAHILVAHELEKTLLQIIMMNGYDYVPLTTVTDNFSGQK